jgi:hypothetical protein
MMILAVARRAVPNLLVSVAGPAVCFLLGRALWGLAGAIGLAVAWNLGAQLMRRIAGRPGSGLLVLGLLNLSLRAGLALGMNSARMYFVAPALITAITGLVYVGSGFSSSPLTTRMVGELVPPSVLDPSNPRWSRLLRKGCIVYGAEQVVVAGISLLMIANVSVTTYAAVHPLASWAVLAAVAGMSVPLFRSAWHTPATELKSA